MRLRRFLIAFVLVAIAFASAPAGYYDSAAGLTGSSLRQELHNVIDDHIVKSYDYLWTAFATTDIRTSLGSDYIWCMYTELEFHHDEDQSTGSSVYTTYNREHSWPKSWTSEYSPHYTDLFHLYPTQAYANSNRSNLPYGEVATGAETWVSENGTKKGPARSGLGYTGTVFEPIDEYKGDFARTYFYISTRYLGEDSTWDPAHEYEYMAIGAELKQWAVDMLLEWHHNDPVSTKETVRNDEVYAIQNNRNPFIDNPAYADSIWSSSGGSLGAPVAQSATSITTSGFTANWNSVSGATGYKLYVSTLSDFSSYIANYGPKDVGNVTSEILTSLSSGTDYYYRVRAYDASSESANSNEISLTTSSGSVGGSGEDHWTENFDSGVANVYTTGIQTLSTGDWYTSDAYQESSADSRGGVGHAVRLNDDTNGASLRTPAVNTVGTVTFYYRELNSGGGTFILEKSYNNSDWTQVTTQAFSGETYTEFSYAVNDAASTIYLRVVNDNQAGHLIIDDFTVNSYSAADPEPTNHPSSFISPSKTESSITLTWSDNDGAQIAAGFLVKASTGSVIDPIDGTAESNDIDLSDGSGAVNVSHGIETYEWTGLTENQTYNFKIFAYTNSDTSIDYKTASAPSVSVTTDEAVAAAEDFIEDFSTGDKYTVTLGSEGQGGSEDYFIRTDDNLGHNISPAYLEADGYFFAAQDIDDVGWVGSASPSELTWTGIDISGNSATQLSIDFASIATLKIDVADYVHVQYRIDGGSWTNILAFENDGTQYNTRFYEDTNFDGNGDGSALSSTFTTFTKDITGTGSTLDVKIIVAVDAGGEDVAFDNLIISNSGGATPICLSSFTAEAKNGVVELSWETASETNNAQFLIYRNDKEIASVEGAGTTTGTTYYNYVDATVVPGITYTYVLADVDYANILTYYDDKAITLVIEDDLAEADFKIGAAYPNPFNPSALIPIELSREAVVEAKLYTLAGREIATLANGTMNAGVHELCIAADNMTTGLYLVKVMIENVIDVQKVVFVK